MYASTVADHDECGVELADLIQQKISNNKPDEVTLVVFNILPVLHHLLELLKQDRHSDRKDVNVLVEVLPHLVILILVQPLGINMVILGVETQPLHPRESLVVLADVAVRETLIERLTVSEHEFLKEPFGVDLPHVVQLRLLLGKTYV